jgi:deazaflavin-dependent oxidoreductase (nitroreductase family)
MSNMNDFNAKLIEEFRANGGKVGGEFANTPLLLLTTKGAKSGKTRTNPLAYVHDKDHLIVIASKGGAPTHPDWYHNVRAHPEVTVEVGTEKFHARAKPAEEPERVRLFAQMVKKNPGFAEYQQKTKRKIPVVVLEQIK